MTTLDKQTRERLDGQIEAFIDADLSPNEAEQIRRALVVDATLAQEVGLARQIASTLRSMPDEECPDSVLRGVMAHVRSDIRNTAWKSMQDFFLSLNMGLFKPALAVAMLILIVLTSTQIGRSVQESPIEVAQALREVKWTLAYLSDAGRSTATTVKAEVIENQVVAPMSRNFTPILEN